MHFTKHRRNQLLFVLNYPVCQSAIWMVNKINEHKQCQKEKYIKESGTFASPTSLPVVVISIITFKAEINFEVLVVILYYFAYPVVIVHWNDLDFSSLIRSHTIASDLAAEPENMFLLRLILLSNLYWMKADFRKSAGSPMNGRHNFLCNSIHISTMPGDFFVVPENTR